MQNLKNSKPGTKTKKFTKVIGTFLNAAASEFFPGFSTLQATYQAYHEEDITHFSKDLDAEIEKVEKSKVDHKFLNSRDGYRFMRKIYQAWMLSHSKQRVRSIILKLFRESINKDRKIEFDTNTEEAFLDLIIGLTDNDIAFIINFYKGHFEGQTRVEIYEKQLGEELDNSMAAGILYQDATWDSKILVSKRGTKFAAYLAKLTSDEENQPSPRI